jgi:tetratricopeptide (TPR) repeat protein
MRAARWGETHDAAPRLEEAYRRGARDAEFLHVLGLVRVHEGDLAGAETAYLEGARVEGEGVENLTGLATVGLLRKDPAKTLAAYDAILQKRPRHGPALLGRAYALCLLGRTEDAGRALDAAEEAGASPAHVKRLRQLVLEVRNGKPSPTM